MSPRAARGETAGGQPLRRRSPPSTMIDLAAIAAPPAVWFLHLNISYLLVPPSCRTGHRWFLAAVTVAALALIVPSTWRSLRARRRDDPQGLETFLGSFGTWFAALFAVAILLVGASALVVGPCR